MERDRRRREGWSRRPRAWEPSPSAWHLGLVPESWQVGDGFEPHPARRCGIFAVHGIGRHERSRLGETIRFGLEDALASIRTWERTELDPAQIAELPGDLPPPFIFEGYWADYADIAQSFPEEWARFHDAERRFFEGLWARHTTSTWRTARWVIRQQLRLLHPPVIRELRLSAWCLYLPLQAVAAASLVLALFRRRRVLSSVIADVRLYCQPRGGIERAIVQKIDYRVGQRFLKMIGLGWDFRALADGDCLVAFGEPVRFERVTWVAHSLGTVISYNVLSDLFHRAATLEATGDDEQRRGVARFRRALCRFVTLGSPLDKVAYLFGEEAVRPWPRGDRSAWLEGGEPHPQGGREWWVNFYHVLDPVSEPLEARLVCGDRPPLNLHLRSSWIPGAAHLAYWYDHRCLRFLAGRTYGTRYLRDREFQPSRWWVKVGLTWLSYMLWTVAMVGGLAAAAYLVWSQGPGLVRVVLGAIKEYFASL